MAGAALRHRRSAASSLRQEMIEIGLPGTRCVAGMSVTALEAPRIGSLQEMLTWLDKYSDQLRWRPEDEGDDLPF